MPPYQIGHFNANINGWNMFLFIVCRYFCLIYIKEFLNFILSSNTAKLFIHIYFSESFRHTLWQMDRFRLIESF